MTRHLHTVLKAIGAVAVLGIVGNSVSLAATGQGFILGKSNTANKVTTLQRTTNGPVLNIRNRNVTAAPFTVNGRGRVPNLNADRLDGLDSTAFARRTATTELAGRAAAAEAKATQAESTAAAADTKATSAQNAAAAVTPQLPIAQAFIDLNGAAATGSRGITSSTWNSASGRYEIRLSGAPNYFYNEFVTQITPSTDDCVVRTSSVSNQLLVFPEDRVSGSAMQCRFALTVTAL